MAYELEIEPFELEVGKPRVAATVRPGPVGPTRATAYLTVKTIQLGLLPKARVLEFSCEVKSPRDLATGQASGKRQYQPLRVLIPWDQPTVQLFQALVRNENVASVLIEILQLDKEGREVATGTIELGQVRVVSVRQFTSLPGSAHEVVPQTEVAFVFQKITISQGQVTETDDWRP